ncbi:MAG: glycosyltransferase [Planctomycetes bacterium]|nr:glycosyltransferase [Planctomycetota bacterium]
MANRSVPDGGAADLPVRQVRLYGDPLRGDAWAVLLLGALAALQREGVACAVCLTPVSGSATGRPVPLSDGRQSFTANTELDPSRLREVLAAAGADREVAATAPLVVFGDVGSVRQAELEFPEACRVVVGTEIHRLLPALRQLESGLERECPSPSLDRAALQPWLDMPAPAEHGPPSFLHLGGSPEAGTEAVLAAFAVLRGEAAGHLAELRVFVPAGAPSPTPQPGVVWVAGFPGPDDLRRATAVVQPCRSVADGDWAFWLSALAAGRPLVLSSFADTNRVLHEHGTYLPVGGTRSGPGGAFAPDASALLHALRTAAGDTAAGDTAPPTGVRGRAHVLRWHLAGRYAVVRERRSERPLIVLEAPLLETSSASVLTAATARALLHRDRVEVRLRPRAPFPATGLDAFARAYPDLVPHLGRIPECPDLWLSAGWPVRTSRPPARCHAIRLDYEYGALPVQMTPAVTEEADWVVVHSEHVRRTALASGCDPSTLLCVPHGVDGAVFHDCAAPSQRVLEFKRGRTAILFSGGLIWRKGFDLVVKALLDGVASPAEVCLVVKPNGSRSSYAGHNLDDLVERVQRFPQAIDVMLLDDELTAAQMAGVYTACDLLLHPYRGEGFGLPVLEARACGLPVAVTTGGATDDFCTGPGVVGIPSAPRPVELQEPHCAPTWVLEPDFGALRVLLRRALDHAGALRGQARAAAAAIRAQHGWERAAEQLERLTRHAAAVLEPVPAGRRAPVAALDQPHPPALPIGTP